MNNLTAGNWSVADDSFSEMFLKQNLNQFWVPEEVSLSRDLLSWETLSEDEKDSYMKVLAGLTLLDTIQGDNGMPAVADTVTSHQQKAVLSFMGAMENAVHARSYSTIFQTLATAKEIEEAFNWVENDPVMQKKAKIINDFYLRVKAKKAGKYLNMMVKVASVFLESFLFYSGFFYPLWFAGKGKLRGAGEIISLIVRDESVHGVFVGLLFQTEYNALSESEQQEVKDMVLKLIHDLIECEKEYTRYLYDKVDLTHEVMQYVKYNANKSLQNLGFEDEFEHEEVNMIVMNGINTVSQDHDFFSQKGNSYRKPTVVGVQDNDFIFD